MARHLVCIVSMFLGSAVLAKNLESRVGFGVTVHDFDPTPALSARYHPSPYLSMTGLVGFNTADTNNSFVIGGKLCQNAHLEENLNFYVGIGAFLVTNRGGTTATSGGIEFQGILGGEFFFSGLPNLGLSFETGVAMNTVRKISFRTVGSGFVIGGIHYYF